MHALRLSMKIIKQNVQYTHSWPFSGSLHVIVWKRYLCSSETAQISRIWWRFIRYRVHSNYTVIYQEGKLLQQQQLSCEVNKVNKVCCSGHLTGQTAMCFRSSESLKYCFFFWLTISFEYELSLNTCSKISNFRVNSFFVKLETSHVMSSTVKLKVPFYGTMSGVFLK